MTKTDNLKLVVELDNGVSYKIDPLNYGFEARKRGTDTWTAYPQKGEPAEFLWGATERTAEGKTIPSTFVDRMGLRIGSEAGLKGLCLVVSSSKGPRVEQSKIKRVYTIKD